MDGGRLYLSVRDKSQSFRLYRLGITQNETIVLDGDTTSGEGWHGIENIPITAFTSMEPQILIVSVIDGSYIPFKPW